ncbi:MAG: hypothetical protein H7Y00_03705, partial [Fimbriimonadaceae bacterium]|nr:hypothetical protein [Chitinophagales bacterium]
MIFIKKLFLFIIFFSASVCFGQNYRVIDPNTVSTFTKIDTAEFQNYFLFAKVDSIATEGPDTIYYFNQLLDTTETPICANDTTAFGTKMIIKNDTDATHIFFNANGDSIFIKTKLFVTEQWKVYKFPDNSYVKAYVTGKDYLGILPGIFDSLYRIQLNVLTEAGSPLPDVFPNNTKLDLTKNYGLVEFWPFDNFPNPEPAMILRGITDPDTNYVDVHSQNAFDFSLGHEFHIKEESLSGEDYILTLKKYFILTKTDYTDHVEYTAIRTLWQEIEGISETDTLRTIDTVNLNYNYTDYAFLDTIELKVFQKSRFGFSDWIHDDSLYAGVPYKIIYDLSCRKEY